MTLDEAIDHAKEVARTCDDSQCAADNLQLAEWLRQARGAEKGARWYTAKIQELEEHNADLREHVISLNVENARLRKLVSDMRYNSTWTDEAREHIDGVLRELGIEVDG